MSKRKQFTLILMLIAGIGTKSNAQVNAVNTGILYVGPGVVVSDLGDFTNKGTTTLENAGNVLKIGGNITNSGTFYASNGTIEMNGLILQTISANAFQNNSLKNLIIGNTNAAGVTLGGTLDIYGSLTYNGAGKKLTTNDVLTLKSTATNTAWVGDMTGNTITGKVTVERYIPARKAWQFLSIPTSTTQTVAQTWQEGCGANQNCVTYFGTQITGSGGTAAGFDLYSATPSMKTYSSATNTWVGIANTSITIKATDGYMTFIRGDRSATAFNSVPTQTVMRTKGGLYTGDQTPIPVNADKFASIGNPYASELDMRNITKTGVKDFFYLWDPNLGSGLGYGGYQTFFNDLNGNYMAVPGMGSYGAFGSPSNYIQSGQAFFVQGTGTGGSVTIMEHAKMDHGQVSSFVAGRLPQVGLRMASAQLRTSLYGVNGDNSIYMIDGTLSNYSSDYSNGIDEMDAIKSTNVSENLSIRSNSRLLVVERRNSIAEKDTIFLNLSNEKAQKYRFEFTADGLGQSGLSGFLEDNYLHTSTPLTLDGSTIADFNIVNIPGSYAADRFRIVFTQASVLPITFTSIKAYQQNKDIAVEWKTENESNLQRYVVEKSVDGNHFATSKTVAANNTAASIYSWLDENPSEGYNYYRILSIDKNGKTAYSTVVKVLIGKQKQDISIYPNPIQNGTINLQLTKQPAGIYGLRLLNNRGQVMMSKQITLAEGSSTETIQLDKYTAHGMYHLEVTKPNGDIININMIY